MARGLCGPRQQRLSFLPDAAPEFARWLGSGEGGALVRREKGAYIQWEEDIPPGNLRSSRKQSRQCGRAIDPLKPLMQKVRVSESASVQTTMKIERRASLEKPNVPVEIVGANRRPQSGREESVASIFREDRGSGGGMCAKDRGVNTGDPRQCLGASPSNRRSARIGAGLKLGVGKVHSSEEASNDRGAKGP